MKNYIYPFFIANFDNICYNIQAEKRARVQGENPYILTLFFRCDIVNSI